MKGSTLARIWLAPLLIGLLSLFGLVVALLADGWGDILSWVALAVPVLVCIYYWAGRGQPKSQRN